MRLRTSPLLLALLLTATAAHAKPKAVKVVDPSHKRASVAEPTPGQHSSVTVNLLRRKDGTIKRKTLVTADGTRTTAYARPTEPGAEIGPAKRTTMAMWTPTGEDLTDHQAWRPDGSEGDRKMTRIDRGAKPDRVEAKIETWGGRRITDQTFYEGDRVVGSGQKVRWLKDAAKK